MKTKNLVIIFILFLLITLVSGLVVFLTGEKKRSALNAVGEIINFSSQPAVEKKQDEVIKNKPVLETADEGKPTVQPEKIAPLQTNETKPTVQPGKTVQPETGREQAEQIKIEQIQAKMIVNGVEYRTAIKPDSSVYDLMNALKEQKKIDFKGKSYSNLGFFVEEINSVKNNPSGKNWLYYINGQPAQVGISYYNLKNNDVIEWKYENKSF